MKAVLVLFLLCSVLVNVQSHYLISKLFNKQHEAAPQVRYEEQKFLVPAQLAVEYTKSIPTYNYPVATQEVTDSKSVFNVFGSLKNKFKNLFKNKHMFNVGQIQTQPIVYGKNVELRCYQVKDQNEVETKPIIESQLIDENAIKPNYIQSSVLHHDISQEVAPVYEIPIQQQSDNGKLNIFSKIKDHFHGNKNNAKHANIRLLLTSKDQTNTVLNNDENLVGNPSEVYNSIIQNGLRTASKEIESDEKKAKSQ